MIADMDLIPDRSSISPKARNWGGARPGSGPKPSALTVQKREVVAMLKESATEAIAFLDRVMRDEAADLAQRVQAAKLLLDRAWGKPSVQLNIARAEEPMYDAELIRRLLSDPRGMDLVCELDARIAALPGVDRGKGDGHVEP